MEVAEYQSILAKVTECREGVEEKVMVAWLTIIESCNSSTEYLWPFVFGRKVASLT